MAMNRLCVRSTSRTALAIPLVLAVFARGPVADGLLLHDHSDRGIHSHTVTLDDLGEGAVRVAWHHHHDDSPIDDHDDGNNDSDGE